MAINSFQDMIAWQRAHELTLMIYKATEKFPKSEEFGLKSQIRRCAVSVPSNLAEGFKRKSSKESVRFYNISEGSLEELKYQLILARDLNYIDQCIYQEIYNQAEETGRLICGWIKSQKL